jgi:orotidine-5'-phosphate decarboxylase
MKNPLVVDFSVLPSHIPPHILETEADFVGAYKRFCLELLEGLKDTVPAVRLDFNSFALLGSEGLLVLEHLLLFAKSCGYYVILDGVEVLSAQSAERAAEILFSDTCSWYFNGLIIPAYIGSDGIRPYAARLKETNKSLFVVARTANRSAPEMQDLLSGSRLAHIAKTDVVNRFSDSLIGRCGYSQVAVVAAASSADSLRALRSKFKSVFLLLDGSDYPNANMKNCSFAFDSLGHGAIACVGTSVTAAWQEENQPKDYVELAIQSALRLKKNLTRYVSVL